MLSAEHIKKYAAEVGFSLCGIAPVRPLARNETLFRAWLGSGRHAGLAYLERHLEKRFDPSRLVEGALTVVVCAAAYKNPAGEGYPEQFAARIASYALFPDYHTTIRKMLRNMFGRLAADDPQLRGRVFVDTAPLLEKQWAVEAGLGWIGRQSLLVTPRYGSYVLLGELVLADVCDAYDAPFEGSRCGRCLNCVESCPTGALCGDRMIDARRCISCHTVECACAVRPPLHGWIFGCDACANCCPYNRKAPMHTLPAFDPLFDPLTLTPEAWLAMDETEFERRFGTTPLVRSGLEAIRRNLL